MQINDWLVNSSCFFPFRSIKNIAKANQIKLLQFIKWFGEISQFSLLFICSLRDFFKAKLAKTKMGNNLFNCVIKLVSDDWLIYRLWITHIMSMGLGNSGTQLLAVDVFWIFSGIHGIFFWSELILIIFVLFLQSIWI